MPWSWAFLGGILIPYAALVLFLAGVIWRVVTWASAPVPFRIPVTCGQQASLPWIRSSKIENPSGPWGAACRVALEALVFRSLIRNGRAELSPGPTLTFRWEKWLWLASLVFHWSLLIVLIRHLRFFTEPVPGFVGAVERADGFFRVGQPVLYATNVTLVVSLGYLLARRFLIRRVRYISQYGDYILPGLILAVALSGMLMRYVFPVDVPAAKEMALGLVTFRPRVVEGLGAICYIHLLLVSLLAALFPFSKLMHMAGIFLSPTRNLAANSRARRHVNPWNYPVAVHTYAEYEEEFREKMRQAGIPVEEEGAESCPSRRHPTS